MKQLENGFIRLEEAGLDDPAGLAGLLAGFQDGAICLVEATDRATLQPFSQLPDLTGCFSVIVCDPKAELRIEKEPFSPNFSYRYITDSPDEGREVWIRESDYYLRRPIKADHAHLEIAGGHLAKLRFKEYFSPDDSGWLTLAASRLAGLGQGE
jgi:hypothetical protein